jgi:hypothetical protein
VSSERDRDVAADPLGADLLRSAELLDVPSEEGKQRVRSLFLGTGAVGLGVAGGALGPRAASFLAKKWLLLVLLGAAALGGLFFLMRARHPSAAPLPVPISVAVVPASAEPIAVAVTTTTSVPQDTVQDDSPRPASSTPAPATALPARSLTGAAASTGAPPSAPPTSSGSTLAAEIAALDHARDLVQQGRAADAQRELDDFDRRFPNSTLAQEAAVTRIEALVRAGRNAEATSAGNRFLAGHPDSSHAQRVRDLLRSMPKGTP